MSATFGLSEAMSFYAGIGYEFVRTPWLVSVETIRHTYKGSIEGVPMVPYPNSHWPNDGDRIVGSAEQGFLAVYDKLEVGKKYMSLTPCMRHEKHYDDKEHLKGFLKLELFVPGEQCAGMILNHAMRFFGMWIRPSIVHTEQGFDIVNSATNVELGSYYNAQFNPPGTDVVKRYSCGTGIAWERMLYAMGSPQTNLWESP